MKRLMANHKQKKAILIALAAPLMFSPALLMAVTGTSEPVVAIARQAQTIVSVHRFRRDETRGLRKRKNDPNAEREP